MPVRLAVPDDANTIARVHVSSWWTSYSGLVPDDFMARITVERREQQWRAVLTASDHPLLYVAVDDAGQIVGFVNGGENRDAAQWGFDGELYAIYLLREAQGKGYGKALIRLMGQRLHHEGFQSMILWVFEENPHARRFYEALGGVLVPDALKTIEVEGKTLREIAYGWRDLTIFDPATENS